MVFGLRHVVLGDTHFLGHNRTYTLGKSRRTSILLKEATANNRHARIRTTDKTVTLEDLNSGNGTWVNKKRIFEPVTLNHGDVIVFGKDTSSCKYVIMFPGLKAQIDVEVPDPVDSILDDTLNELSIKIHTDDVYCSSCTHFLIESVSLDTLKRQLLLNYLIDRTTIVTPHFFKHVLDNIKEAPLVPNIYRYMPGIDDFLRSKGIRDIRPDKNRKNLFKNFVFIFFDENSMEELNDLIFKCNGDVKFFLRTNNFFNELLDEFREYTFVAVNHQPDATPKMPRLVEFVKIMECKRKRVMEINFDDIYVTILKGRLKKPKCNCCDEPGVIYPKKFPESPKLTIKTEDDSDESTPDDIFLEIEKPTSPMKNIVVNPLNPCSRLAIAYKNQTTLRETLLTNFASSSTVNKWISKNKQPAAKELPQEAEELVIGNPLVFQLPDSPRDNGHENENFSPVASSTQNTVEKVPATQNNPGEFTRINPDASEGEITDDSEIMAPNRTKKRQNKRVKFAENVQIEEDCQGDVQTKEQSADDVQTEGDCADDVQTEGDSADDVQTEGDCADEVQTKEVSDNDGQPVRSATFDTNSSKNNSMVANCNSPPNIAIDSQQNKTKENASSLSQDERNVDSDVLTLLLELDDSFVRKSGRIQTIEKPPPNCVIVKLEPLSKETLEERSVTPNKNSSENNSMTVNCNSPPNIDVDSQLNKSKESSQDETYVDSEQLFAQTEKEVTELDESFVRKSAGIHFIAKPQILNAVKLEPLSIGHLEESQVSLPNKKRRGCWVNPTAVKKK